MAKDYYHEFYRDDDGSIFFVVENEINDPEFTWDDPSLTLDNVCGVGGPFASLDRALFAMQYSFGEAARLGSVRETVGRNNALLTVKEIMEQSPYFVQPCSSVDFKEIYLEKMEGPDDRPFMTM